MENFYQIFTLLAEEKGIRLNSDILETGVLNLLVLIGILVFSGQKFVVPSLQERQKKVSDTVKNAETKLNEAVRRLDEAQKQLDQAQVVISEIKSETLATKTVLLESDALDAKRDLKVRFERALSAFRSKERQIFMEIKQQILVLVLKQTVIRAKQTFDSKERATKLINDTITKLEGDLL